MRTSILLLCLSIALPFGMIQALDLGTAAGPETGGFIIRAGHFKSGNVESPEDTVETIGRGSFGASLDIPVFARLLAAVNLDFHQLDVTGNSDFMFNPSLGLKYAFRFGNGLVAVRPKLQSGVGIVTKFFRLNDLQVVTLAYGGELLFYGGERQALVIEYLFFDAPWNLDGNDVTLDGMHIIRVGVAF